MRHLQHLRLQRGAEHLCQLGPRAMAEFLAEVARATDAGDLIADLLAEYEGRLTPQLLRVTGGDRFPPRPLYVVTNGARQ